MSETDQVFSLLLLLPFARIIVFWTASLLRTLKDGIWISIRDGKIPRFALCIGKKKLTL